VQIRELVERLTGMRVAATAVDGCGAPVYAVTLAALAKAMHRIGTSSATLLAPSTSFVENILKNLRPGMTDRQQLFAMRATIVIFTGLVLAYAVAMKGTSIYELVSTAYQVTLVGAFVPLVMGLYWKRATTQGAILSVTAGIAVWILFFPQVGGEALSKQFPGQLAGLVAAFAGMVVGSLAPQKLRNRHEHVKHVAGLPAREGA
jgi:Na+/proline symporter